MNAEPIPFDSEIINKMLCFLGPEALREGGVWMSTEPYEIASVIYEGLLNAEIALQQLYQIRLEEFLIRKTIHGMKPRLWRVISGLWFNPMAPVKPEKFEVRVLQLSGSLFNLAFNHRFSPQEQTDGLTGEVTVYFKMATVSMYLVFLLKKTGKLSKDF